MAEALRESGKWLEVVAGINSVVVQFDALVMNHGDATVELLSGAAIDPGIPEPEPRLVEIPVVYDGVDFDEVCAQVDLTRDEFVAAHTSGTYVVDMLGFTPGFAYVGGLPDSLDIPRLASPRQHVPAGSIGIAGGRTGVYALPGPAGWPIIGHTTMRLFDADAEDPFALAGGMHVRFVDAGATP